MSDKKRLHIRRCHICGEVTEQEEALVVHCLHCGKSMAPFFYFDDFKVRVFADTELRPEPPDGGDRVPVRGLTAHW